ncbi:MAG: glycosyltransferase [Massilibacteroides sp.]|nr:glycosyltransferase [Massilibacteroides sp.]MDD3062274.1 glycosyltransferase [Massilibacteroides sp.]MDD4113987.1 glycosyltransferase [Massilibacteroides sp.]MDD4660047.1 glycosyltransferase [Massilibacteroides sp.]
MKILILNTSEMVGGAAIAANRLMKALNKNGVNTKMLVRDKLSTDENVYTVNSSWIKRKLNFMRFLWERLILFLLTGFDRKNLFRASIANTGIDISKYLLVYEADIIHLHWINHGFLSLKDISKLQKLNKPIVWTMHDMWPCSGIYHHVKNLPFYTDTWGKRWLTKHTSKKKKEIYKSHRISFVCCSHWLEEEAKKSILTKSQNILCIPNPIDTTIFHQINHSTRNEFGLPENKILLLFGALNVTDKQKGINYLINSLFFLEKEFPHLHKNIELVVFGQVKSDIHSLFNVPIHPIGYLRDPKQIVRLYNAVNLFVTSSLEENLPNTIMESMACGIPCVGFRIGGIPEMIDHKKNGYVSEYKNAEDLANGIKWIIEHPNPKKLSEACINKVKSHYSEDIVARQYIDLYESVLKK